MKVAILLCVSCLLVLAAAQSETRADTECEAWNKREVRRSPSTVGVVPQCEANGEYKALQCHSARWCQCWKKDGRPITQGSTKIKTCECIREQDDAGGKVGAFRPECRENGTYHSRQCWPSAGTCWCAGHDGRKLTEPRRNSGNLTC